MNAKTNRAPEKSEVKKVNKNFLATNLPPLKLEV
jgi:hypothetical protein